MFKSVLKFVKYAVLSVVGIVVLVIGIGIYQATSESNEQASTPVNTAMGSILAVPAQSNGDQTNQKPAANDPLNPRWRYSKNTDELTGKTGSAASVESLNFVSLDFPYSGAQRATLTVRQHPKYGNDVVFKLERSQLICQYSNCTVELSFDGAKSTTVRATKAADGSSNVFFLQGYAALLAKIQRAKTLKVVVTIYKQGEHVFNFNVAGLDTAK